MENLNAAGTGNTTSKMRAMATSTAGKDGHDSAVPEGVKGECRFFLKAAGCRRGAKCPFRHDLSSLTKQQKARKCLACGSEEHRQKDCPTRSSSPMKTRTAAVAGNKPMEDKGGAQLGPQVQSQTVATTDGLTGASSTGRLTSATDPSLETRGKPVDTLEQMLHLAAQVLQVPGSTAMAPSSLKVLRVTGIAKTCVKDGDEGPMALLDSGATHALRMADSEQEWLEAEVVRVAQSVNMRMNSASTLLLPPRPEAEGSSTMPILPMGELVFDAVVRKTVQAGGQNGKRHRAERAAKLSGADRSPSFEPDLQVGRHEVADFGESYC